MSPASTQTPLVIFCGKGGVGKTTLSLSLGLLHAKSGRKVVVVSSHPLAELAVSISLDGLKEADPIAAANLFVIHIEPRQVLAGIFAGQLPSKLLARTVLSSKIYRSLIEVAPGLKEIAFLSRLHELAARRAEGDRQPHFDLLLWDAPATGHFLETLRVSQQFETYLSGPFSARGKELQQFFSERSNLLLFPVTTLEEMAIEETMELCGKLQKELRMAPAGIACNLVSPMLSAPEQALQETAAWSAHLKEQGADLAFVLDRHRIERERFAALRSSLRLPLHLIHRVPSWKSDLELLAAVSAQMRQIPLDPR